MKSGGDIVAQEPKSPLGTSPFSECLVQVLAPPHFQNSIIIYQERKQAGDDPNTWVSITHVEDWKGIPGS